MQHAQLDNRNVSISHIWLLKLARPSLFALAMSAYALPLQAAVSLPVAVQLETTQPEAVAPVHESVAVPSAGKLQSRLDALQHITVTAARAPAGDVPAPSATVQAVLDDAHQAERAVAADMAPPQD